MGDRYEAGFCSAEFLLNRDQVFIIYPRKVEGGVAQLSSGFSALGWLVQVEFVRETTRLCCYLKQGFKIQALNSSGHWGPPRNP